MENGDVIMMAQILINSETDTCMGFKCMLYYGKRPNVRDCLQLTVQVKEQVADAYCMR